MTQLLADMLRNYFEIKNPNHISVHGLGERIELNFCDERLITNAKRRLKKKDVTKFNNYEIIEKIAEEIFAAGTDFDVDFLYEIRGDIGPAIFFMPSKNDSYNQNYHGHYIQVHLPNIYPQITIAIGKRENSFLLDKQRENYFEFVKQVHGLFLTRYTIKEIYR
jgi:hypothetical protein